MPDLHLLDGFSNIKKLKILDKDNVEVGRPIDFTFDDSYVAQKFILGGSRIEEFKERIGLKDDDDPVVPISIMQKSDTEGSISITASSDELKNKLQEGAFAKNETLFSKFCKFTIQCKDGDKVGRVVDAIFHDDNSVDFVIGEGSITEFLEKVGVMGDFDLLLPVRNITTVNKEESTITVNKSKEELQVILKNQPLSQIDPSKQYGRINLVGKYPESAETMRYKTP